MGAGLGGGSADGAFTLKMLDHLFALNLSDTELKNYAAQLGSDCPFFVRNQPCLVTGTGTTLQPIELDLSEYSLAVLYPEVHVGTAAAYAGIRSFSIPSDLVQILKQAPSFWLSELKNDFEASILKKHPKIQAAKAKLEKMGARYTAMSGSGSAVFGIFPSGFKPKEKVDFFTSL
jgi:4-diphosphocytidyl-2-C-methyl-D-erythritol kinase